MRIRGNSARDLGLGSCAGEPFSMKLERMRCKRFSHICCLKSTLGAKLIIPPIAPYVRYLSIPAGSGFARIRPNCSRPLYFDSVACQLEVILSWRHDKGEDGRREDGKSPPTTC